MNVSDVALAMDEDPASQKFQINIAIPWIKEEHWRFQNDGIMLKSIISNIKPSF
jgi:hypothetical protein